ncbi:TPA: hypothetical protein ACQ31I_000217 [Yersinia enterocolitica]
MADQAVVCGKNRNARLLHEISPVGHFYHGHTSAQGKDKRNTDISWSQLNFNSFKWDLNSQIK